MGHDARRNSERFQAVKTFTPQPAQQSTPIAIPGYCDLGKDENGRQEVLFVPICRRIWVETNAEGHEVVTIHVEDGQTISYGPAQSLELMYRTGIRQRPVESLLIVVPDSAIKPATPFGQ